MEREQTPALSLELRFADRLPFRRGMIFRQRYMGDEYLFPGNLEVNFLGKIPVPYFSTHAYRLHARAPDLACPRGEVGQRQLNLKKQKKNVRTLALALLVLHIGRSLPLGAGPFAVQTYRPFDLAFTTRRCRLLNLKLRMLSV